ncbi:MAG: 4Fe-4S binding protein [Coriobacteriales bacterium]|nr:4Fe-4S binding protein [Coriobacteriales bacterium]
MAAKKRDFLDEIIDMQQDWQALSNAGNDLVDQFTDEAPVYDPAAFKERPRANSTFCAVGATQDPRACTRCLEVCPTNAIRINGATVRVGDDCRKCGLCAAVCPTEVFMVHKTAPMTLYDTIARAATAYEQCYLTCTRALGRLPKPNEVLLPCVGAVPCEVLFDLLCEYPNISVYLPLGICDRCKTTTGEEAFSNAIAQAEEWSGESVGLEVDEKDLSSEQKRAYKRSQFVSNMTQAGTRLVSRGVPVLAGAQAVANRLQEHSKQITQMQKTLEAAVGTSNGQVRRRVLTRKRRLVMNGLQKYPDLADEMLLAFPQVDVDACTMCGDCTKACTIHALEQDAKGRVLVEPSYCVNCGACAIVCPEGAITMREEPAVELVVPDPKAEERKRQRERVAKLKTQGKQTLEKGLGLIEDLANDE